MYKPVNLKLGLPSSEVLCLINHPYNESFKLNYIKQTKGIFS